ncbi:MAG: hypothetical protein OEY14_08105 [Myxococcales bacterium]|nr:hypothetical protein [Myxococcales bacterium]
MSEEPDRPREEEFRSELIATLTATLSRWQARAESKDKGAAFAPEKAEEILEHLLSTYRFYARERGPLWRRQDELLAKMDANAQELGRLYSDLEKLRPRSKGFHSYAIEDESLRSAIETVHLRVDAIIRRRAEEAEAAGRLMAEREEQITSRMAAGESRRQAKKVVEVETGITLDMAALDVPVDGGAWLPAFILRCLSFRLGPTEMAKIEYIATRGDEAEELDLQATDFEKRQAQIGKTMRLLGVPARKYMDDVGDP